MTNLKEELQKLLEEIKNQYKEHKSNNTVNPYGFTFNGNNLSEDIEIFKFKLEKLENLGYINIKRVFLSKNNQSWHIELTSKAYIS